MPRTKVLIVSRSSAALQALKASFADAEDLECRSREINNGHANQLESPDWAPDIVVLRFDPEHVTDIAAWSEGNANDKAALIVIGPAGHPEAARLAVRSGAKDFLTEPLTRSDLLAALQRVRLELRRRPGIAAAGIMTAFVGAAGGAGTSFVASNVAHVLAGVGKRPTVLVDLDLNFAPLAHYLDLKPERGILQALEVVDSLDEHALSGYSAMHRSGLRLVSAIPGPVVLSKDLSVQRVSALFELLARHHRHVVVDVPRALDTVNAMVLDLCKQVYIVLQQSVVHVRNASRLARILRDEIGVPADRIRVIVNRYSKDAAVEMEDIRRALDVPEPIAVPGQYKSALESIDTGVPISESEPAAGLSRALASVYREISGDQETPRGSLLRRALPSFRRS
jgi:pilus assembly protein CpaE